MTGSTPTSTTALSRWTRLRAQLGWIIPALLLTAGNCGLCLWPLAADVRYRPFGLSMQVSIVVAGVVFLAAGVVSTARLGVDAARSGQTIEQLRQRNVQLEDDLDSASRAAALALEEHLRLVMADLDLGADSRISLYIEERLTSGGPTGQLRRVARYAKNPGWRSNGRLLVPAAEGVIGSALRNGKCRVALSFEGDAQRVAQHAKWAGLSDGRVVGAMRMPSKEYSGFALTDPQSGSYAAVVVVESTTPGGLRFNRVEAAVRGREEPLMRTSNAMRKGPKIVGAADAS